MRHSATGRCRLCETDGVLRESHILPKWSYERILQRETTGQTQPVLIENGVALLTNRQAKEYLLCEDCEQRFSRDENYVSQIVLQADDSFPWQAALRRTRSMPAGVADSSAVEVDRICRFALSVIWRGSHSAEFASCRLGPYEGDVRQYLLGAKPFPDRGALRVILTVRPDDERPRMDRIVTGPRSERDRRSHVQWFAICGALFHFWIGGEVRPAVRLACFSRVGHVGIGDMKPFVMNVAKQIVSAKKKGKYARQPSD